jgi:hypothetical protein
MSPRRNRYQVSRPRFEAPKIGSPVMNGDEFLESVSAPEAAVGQKQSKAQVSGNVPTVTLPISQLVLTRQEKGDRCNCLNIGPLPLRETKEREKDIALPMGPNRGLTKGFTVTSR